MRQDYAGAQENLDIELLLNVTRTAYRFGQEGWTEAGSEEKAQVAASLIRLAEQTAKAAAEIIHALSNERVFGEPLALAPCSP